MASSDQLKRRRNQYITAYNRANTTADNIYQATKTISKMLSNTKACYVVNDSDIGGSHLQGVYDTLVADYNYIVKTVLPQTKSIINYYTNAYYEQLRVEQEEKDG